MNWVKSMNWVKAFLSQLSQDDILLEKYGMFTTKSGHESRLT